MVHEAAFTIEYAKCFHLAGDGVTTDNEVTRLPWQCQFGTSREDPDWCGIKQGDNEHGDWIAWSGLSPNPNTGPPGNSVNNYGVF